MKSQKFRKPITVHDETDAKRCAQGKITIIDDDYEILKSLKNLLDLSGYMTYVYSTADDFLKTLDSEQPDYPGPFCIVSDVKMENIDGIDLLKRLQTKVNGTHFNYPIILMSGHCGIYEAIDAFRAGAVDFLVKPFEIDHLLKAIEKGLQISSDAMFFIEKQTDIHHQISLLTEKEHMVAVMVTDGKRNQEIADEMQLSLRMIKLYRQRIMEKLEINSTVDLVRLIDATRNDCATK